LPHNLIGLIGLFPVAIGIKELLDLHKKGDEEDDVKIAKKLLWSKKTQLPFLTVAAVTFSGGEEIGIYTTVFAINNEVGATIILISVVYLSGYGVDGVLVFSSKLSCQAQFPCKCISQHRK
jgi:cadmium resistance protein CadD (predicted permease)